MKKIFGLGLMLLMTTSALYSMEGLIDKLGTLQARLGVMADLLSKIAEPEKTPVAKPGNLKESEFDEVALDKIALEQGYGYKYGNLQLLEKVAEYFVGKKMPYKVDVPVFKGIPSAKIQQFLKSNNCNLEEKLQTVQARFFTNKMVVQQTLLAKKFPDGFTDALEQIENDIHGAFDKTIAALKQAKAVSLNDLFKCADNHVDELINDIAIKKERLMVRSSGKEDTDKLPNAGGNETRANVIPDPMSVLTAIKDVIASYYSKKSWTQRLNAKDNSLFKKEQLTPVVVQRMIGEKDAKILPKCGVMFTEEAEGGIARYKKTDATGRLVTTGITNIGCSYGHNEGVVNSIIPIDTFYVDQTGFIYPIIRYKTFRLKPAQESGKLELTKNEDAALVAAPALSKDAIMTLKAFAKELERFYKKPMDVEFVIAEDEATIYIVQARPIVYDPEQLLPSYITNIDTIPAQIKVMGQAVGVAGGSLRMITVPENLIVKPTINEALQEYIDSKNPAAVLAVVIGKMAYAISHEATTFRGASEPVIYQAAWQTVQQWRQASEVRLIVDPQQGGVINWKDHKENTINELIQGGSAVRGWFNYPVPSLLSLCNTLQPITEKINKNFDVVIHLLLGKKYALFKNVLANKKTLSWRPLLKEIKQAPESKAALALAILLVQLDTLLNRQAAKLPFDYDFSQRISLLRSYITGIALQIKAVLRISQDDQEYMRRLFPIRFLENLLYQQPELDEIVDGFSATTLLKELISEEKIISQIESKEGKETKIESRVRQLFKLGEHTLTSESADDWNNFLQMLDKVDNVQLGQFAQLIGDLAKLKILPMWLATSFAKNYHLEIKEAGKAPEALVKKLVDEYQTQEAFLKNLNEISKAIQAFNINVFGAGDVKNWQSAWDIFQTSLLNYFVGADFVNTFQNKGKFKLNTLGKLAAIEVMTRFVTLFDNSIKAVNGSTKYKPEDQVEIVRTMIRGYFDLFKCWMALVTPGRIHIHKDITINTYYNLIESILAKAPKTKASLVKTKDFNVAAFVIGSAMSIESETITPPQSLEDAFIWCHQSLLVVLSALSLEAGAGEIEKPPLLQDVAQCIEDTRCEVAYEQEPKPVQRASLIGVNLSSGSMRLLYNFPLGGHSEQIEAVYTKKKKKDDKDTVQLTVRFFGSDSWRWYRIAHYAYLIQKCDNIPVIDLEANDTGTVFTFVIDQNTMQNTGITNLVSYLSELSALTFYKPVDKEFLDFWKGKMKNDPDKMAALLEFMVKSFGIETKNLETSVVHDAWFMEFLGDLVDHGKAPSYLRDVLIASSKIVGNSADEQIPSEYECVKLALKCAQAGQCLKEVFEIAQKKVFCMYAPKDWFEHEEEIYKKLEDIRDTAFKILTILTQKSFQLDEIKNFARKVIQTYGLSITPAMIEFSQALQEKGEKINIVLGIKQRLTKSPDIRALYLYADLIRDEKEGESFEQNAWLSAVGLLQEKKASEQTEFGEAIGILSHVTLNQERAREILSVIGMKLNEGDFDAATALVALLQEHEELIEDKKKLAQMAWQAATEVMKAEKINWDSFQKVISIVPLGTALTVLMQDPDPNKIHEIVEILIKQIDKNSDAAEWITGLLLAPRSAPGKEWAGYIGSDQLFDMLQKNLVNQKGIFLIGKFKSYYQKIKEMFDLMTQKLASPESQTHEIGIKLLEALLDDAVGKGYGEVNYAAQNINGYLQSLQKDVAQQLYAIAQQLEKERPDLAEKLTARLKATAEAKAAV